MRLQMREQFSNLLMRQSLVKIGLVWGRSGDGHHMVSNMLEVAIPTSEINSKDA